MGITRRKKKEKDQRRRQIQSAAKAEFSERGFSKTTMEDIARKAELSPGTLYLYFKNKEELYASLSLKILQFMLRRMKDLSRENDPLKKLGILKKILLDVYEYDPLSLINMFHLQSSETLKNISPALIAEIENRSRLAIGEMAAIFSEGIQRGVFIDRHPVALADIYWGLFSGVVLWEPSKK